MFRVQNPGPGEPPRLMRVSVSEHQTGEGVVPEVHEDLHRDPEEAEGSQQVGPARPGGTPRFCSVVLMKVLSLQVGLHGDVG